MLSWLDCIHHVNTKRFVIWLKVSALNKIQHEERETREQDFHCMLCKLVSFPCLPTIHFWSLSVFTYWKRSKTGQWDGLGTTLLQIKHVLTSYLPIWPNSTINSLCRIGILQLQTQNLFSRQLAFTHTTYTPKLHWSRLQTTSWKWFMNQFTSWLLNRFTAFTSKVSKLVE